MTICSFITTIATGFLKKKLLHNNFRALSSLLSDNSNKIHTRRCIECYLCFFIGGGEFFYFLAYDVGDDYLS